MATTITADSGDDDCVEPGTYTVSGDTLTATITSVSGSGCGDEIGQTFKCTFEVSGDAQTVIASDHDLGTATFVFERVE